MKTNITENLTTDRKGPTSGSPRRLRQYLQRNPRAISAGQSEAVKLGYRMHLARRGASPNRAT